MKHSCEFRVYYEDTDAGGIMYHASFIRFCERGRTEFMRTLGMSCSELDEVDGLIFVIRHLEADYLKSARLDDLLRVESHIHTLKNTSFVMKQSIFCQNSVLFSMKVTVVCIDKSGKPVRLPEKLRTQFKPYVKEEE
ncbi:MAG: tol-pal system-associated acyl-CoA thioesterase [Alphaproteobacteria bacterium]|nr:tol-pal system-associated acyl-CoA thioesterase [Alphaproteobacteria bacterium]